MIQILKNQAASRVTDPDFDFAIEHCPAKFNELPDALSRDPDDISVYDENAYDRPVAPEGGVYAINDVPILHLVKTVQ